MLIIRVLDEIMNNKLTNYYRHVTENKIIMAPSLIAEWLYGVPICFHCLLSFYILDRYR